MRGGLIEASTMERKQTNQFVHPTPNNFLLKYADGGR